MRISLIILAIKLCSCGVETQQYSIDETRNGSVTSSAGVAFHSATGWVNSVNFYVHESAPDQMVEAADSAAQVWNDALGWDVLSFAGVTGDDRGDSLYSSLNDYNTVVYFETDWSSTTGKSSGTLATTIWENSSGSDEIIKGDIIMNAENYDFQDAAAADYDAGYNLVDSETVLIHEFGHLLGLDHVSEDDDGDSVMNPKTFIGPQNYARELSAGDSDNINSLYGN